MLPSLFIEKKQAFSSPNMPVYLHLFPYLLASFLLLFTLLCSICTLVLKSSCLLQNCSCSDLLCITIFLHSYWITPQSIQTFCDLFSIFSLDSHHKVLLELLPCFSFWENIPKGSCCFSASTQLYSILSLTDSSQVLSQHFPKTTLIYFKVSSELLAKNPVVSFVFIYSTS